jgi:hypothetical protein
MAEAMIGIAVSESVYADVAAWMSYEEEKKSNFSPTTDYYCCPRNNISKPR